MSTTTIELPEALGSDARAFIGREHRLLIGDERPPAADGRTFATLDPSTGRELARVPQAGAEDVERAVAAARAAFAEGPWATMPASGRERLMLALAGAVEERAQEFAQIESADNGKPVGLAQYVDVAGTVAHLRYFAGWPTKIEGAVLPVTRAQHALLHPPRAGGGVRADRAVELPAADGRLEARAGARRGLHGRAEAGRADAAERAAPRRAGAGGRLSAGRAERAHRRRLRPARRWWTIPASTRSRSPAPPRWGARSARRPAGRSSG